MVSGMSQPLIQICLILICLRGSRRSKSDLNMDLNGAEISKVVGQIK